MEKIGVKSIVKAITPPAIVHIVKKLRERGTPPEWEYVPEGWKAATSDPAIRGWAQQSVLDAYVKRWPAFVRELSDTMPFGVSPEAPTQHRTNMASHNVNMTYGYALSVAAAGKSSLSMFDWGGGIGHYYLISKTLRPDLAIDYTCKDFQLFTDYGQTLLPDAHFYSGDEWISRRFDFVVASGSLHYSEDWKVVLASLADVTHGYLYLTRVPLIHREPSFVMVQRPVQYGYETEYIGWCLNRQEVLEAAKRSGLALIREFVVEYPPHISNAPEQCDYWGFLFKHE